jgi:hypothetical protein
MNIREMAKEFGFAEAFVFSTEPFTYFERRLEDGALHHSGTSLTADVHVSYSWANAILALILPYSPFPDSVPVSGNYPSSNKAYHASNKLIRALNEQGVQAKRAYIPVRELLIRNGVGVPLKKRTDVYTRLRNAIQRADAAHRSAGSFVYACSIAGRTVLHKMPCLRARLPQRRHLS